MDLDRYNETLDFVASPKYKALSEEQQKLVMATFENAFHSAMHMGQNVAAGKAVKNAVELIEHLSQVRSVPNQVVPPSLFAGLDNCQ
jgi:hypothetical protein